MENNFDNYLQPLPQDYPLQEVARFFQSTLSQPKQEIGNQELDSQPINQAKHNTIIMDVQRTRSTLIPKQYRVQMQKMLIHFCRMQKLEYKQGMNQVLGPFIYLRKSGLTSIQCYNLFRSFFDQYCLNFYYDKDFNSLEIIFKMVTVMIKYHDPALARYLDNYQIEPQIYVISWLMTLFSSKLSLKLCYTLWQLMVVEKDDYFIFFLIIAIIINRREDIIQTKSTSIFTVITNLIFRDEVELLNTTKIALMLRKTTPASLILFFKEHKIFKERQSFQRISSLLKLVDKLNLFLVGPLEVSLKQHFRLGMCEKKCYFCTLKQPLKLPCNFLILRQKFPLLSRLVSMSNDVRTMDYNPDFIVIDMRGNKSKKLGKISGIRIYQVDMQELIETVQQKFNQTFIQSRGRQHFLFLLNNFSFEKQETLSTQQFYFCSKLIKILNSYSYCYLSMLEGGQSSYGYFIKELKLKSQILNSKLVPISQYNQDDHIDSELQGVLPFVGSQSFLEISQIVQMQKLYDNKTLHYYNGQDNSQDYILFILEGFLMLVERNGLLEKLCKFISQKKSITNHIIDEHYILEVPFKPIFLHSLFRIDKLTARVHHNNCILFYLQQSSEESKKNYRRGERKDIWSKTLGDILSQDIQFKEPFQLKRIGFDSMSFDVVKSISSVIKVHYKEILKQKRELILSTQRVQQLNKNIIIEDFDFSRKDPCEVDATDLDI